MSPTTRLLLGGAALHCTLYVRYLLPQQQPGQGTGQITKGGNASPLVSEIAVGAFFRDWHSLILAGSSASVITP
jgi:hypothetical protein